MSRFSRRSPVPETWQELQDDDENVFFFYAQDEEAEEEDPYEPDGLDDDGRLSTYIHPVDGTYRELIEKAVEALVCLHFALTSHISHLASRLLFFEASCTSCLRSSRSSCCLLLVGRDDTARSPQEQNDTAEVEFISDQIREVAIGLTEPEELKQPTMRELFDLIDEDNSGFLDRMEVAALAVKLGSRLPHDVLARAMGEMDEDGDEEVTFEEFRNWWLIKTANERHRRQLHDAFDIVDAEGAGMIDKPAVDRALGRLGRIDKDLDLGAIFDSMRAADREAMRLKVSPGSYTPPT